MYNFRNIPILNYNESSRRRTNPPRSIRSRYRYTRPELRRRAPFVTRYTRPELRVRDDRDEDYTQPFTPPTFDVREEEYSSEDDDNRFHPYRREKRFMAQSSRPETQGNPEFRYSLLNLEKERFKHTPDVRRMRKAFDEILEWLEGRRVRDANFEEKWKIDFLPNGYFNNMDIVTLNLKEEYRAETVEEIIVYISEIFREELEKKLAPATGVEVFIRLRYTNYERAIYLESEGKPLTHLDKWITIPSKTIAFLPNTNENGLNKFIMSHLYDHILNVLRSWFSDDREYYLYIIEEINILCVKWDKPITYDGSGIPKAIVARSDNGRGYGLADVPHDKNEKIGNFFVRNYKSKNGECLANTFARIFGIQNTRNKLGRDFREWCLESSDEELGPIGNGFAVEKLDLWAEYIQEVLGYEATIIVYDIDGKELYSTGDSEDGEELAEGEEPMEIDTDYVIRLLFADYKGEPHYYHIYNKKFKNYKTCPYCRVLYLRTHSQCNISRLNYINKLVATKARTRRVVPNDIFYQEQPDFFNIIVYDLETFPDPVTKQHKVYHAACCDLKDLRGNLDNIRSCTKFFYGADAVSKLVDYFLTIPRDTTICDYNGSRFDEFFIFKEFIARGIEPNFKYGEGQFIRMQVPTDVPLGKRMAKITFWDLCCFTSDKLSNVCKSFGFGDKTAKGDFPHKFVDNWEKLNYVGPSPSRNYFFEPPPADYQEGREDWNLQAESERYLGSDIIATANVFFTIAKMMYTEFKVDIRDFVTLNQLTYEVWSAMHCKPAPLVTNTPEVYNPFADLVKEKHVIEIPTPALSKIILQSIYGGRCFPTKKIFKSKHYEAAVAKEVTYNEIEDDWIINADTVSLYATAMADHEYPVGYHKAATNRMIHEFNKLLSEGKEIKYGIFKCDVKPNKKLMIPSIPRKKFKETLTENYLEADGGLIWDLEDSIGWYNTVDIMNGIRDGYKITLLEGVYWPFKAKIYSEYTQLCFALKKRGDDTKNPVLRKMAKDMSNCNYGKSLQKPKVRSTQILKSSANIATFTTKFIITDYCYLGGDADSIVMTGIARELDGKTVNKPNQLGSFVLGNSRKIMNEKLNILDPYRLTAPALSVEICPFYGDTDSLNQLVSSKKYFDEVVAPQLDATKMGMLANDLKETQGKILYAIYLAPKTYAYSYLGNDNVVREVVKSKGLPKKAYSFKDFQDIIAGQEDYSKLEPKTKEGLVKYGPKHGTYRNGDERMEFEPFGVYSYTLMRKLLNRPWQGRDWMGNVSYPFGYEMGFAI